ncbi:hypothetical protein BTJ48_03401 [Bacillus mycoides]|nr:hypothetical protein BTJ48_03401 [Bacillus mycoides]
MNAVTSYNLPTIYHGFFYFSAEVRSAPSGNISTPLKVADTLSAAFTILILIILAICIFLNL